MLLFSALAAFVVIANGAVQKVAKPDVRILGGYPIQIDEAPYQVALLFDYWEDGIFSQYCGGSIISSTVVLTAAHCTNGTVPENWLVRAGSGLHNIGGQVVGVARIVQHAGFNDYLDNDIALMQLRAALTLGPAVAVITLPSQYQFIPDGANCVVTGWGDIDISGESPMQLQKVNIPTINQKQCAKLYKKINIITNNMICAGVLSEGGKDACHGDSGGPLVIGDVLVGITSWGRNCGDPKYPGVWTRVPAFRNWINSKM